MLPIGKNVLQIAHRQHGPRHLSIYRGAGQTLLRKKEKWGIYSLCFLIRNGILNMSKILCIIDGLTDSDFRTVDYPKLASMHLLRHTDTAQGREPESLGSILRLLGVRRVPLYLRGYAEALGSSIPVGTNDLIFSGNWFALDKQGRCTVPAPAPGTVPDMEGCRYYSLGRDKGLLVFPGMASFVSDIVSFPPYGCSGQYAQQLCPRGYSGVSQVFQALLTEEHCFLPWGQSVATRMAPFPQKAAAVCGAPAAKGLARMLDMTLMPVPGATGDVDTDLIEKSKAALYAAKTHPFVLLHIHGADEAARRGDPEEKSDFLRKADDVVLEMLLRSGHEIYVGSPYGTDPVTGRYISGAQPLFTNVQDNTIRKKPNITEDMLKRSRKTEENRREWAIQQLQRKAKELGSMPRKADFGDVEKIQIKAALGPWPRALEAAGLKERKPKRR